LLVRWASWYRKKGHMLLKDDLGDIIKYKPALLIVGCGSHDRLRVPDETRDYILSLGIKLRVLNTKEACDLFNQLSGKKKIVAALHLTC